MSRIKNSSFVGGSIFETDVDAPTFNDAIVNAIGDTAKAYDQITGKNGETELITHEGNGTGSLLGFAYINQYIGARIHYVNGASGKDGAGGLTWLYACPLFIRPGETEIVVDVFGDEGFGRPGLQACCKLRASTDFDSVIGDQDRAIFDDLGEIEGSGLHHYRARITGVSDGLCLFFVDVDTTLLDRYDEGFDFTAIAVHPNRVRGGAGQGLFRSTDGNVATLATPTASEAIPHRDFDTALLGSLNDSLNGYVTQHLDANQNALLEAVRGSTAGGNETYTLVDHDGAGLPEDTDPQRSRFHAHTRSPFAGTPALPDEPEVCFSLGGFGLGAFRQDGGFVVEVPASISGSPTYGALEWYAPWAKDEAQHDIAHVPLMVPDFSPDKATPAKNTSALRWAVLCGTDKPAGANDVTTWAVAAGTTAALPLAQALAFVPNSTKLALAQGSGLTFDGDITQTFGVALQRTGTQVAVDECVVLGAYFWFDPR